MDKLNSYKRFLPSRKIASTIYKLILVGLTLCLLLSVPYMYIQFLYEESRSELLQPATVPIQPATVPIQPATDLIQPATELPQPATVYYGNDNGCDNIKTPYKMHKLLNDNGTKLSSEQRAQLVKERCRTFVKENNVKFNLTAKCKFDDEAFMISRHYDLSLCYHCKVVSTNIKRVFYGLDHSFSLTDNINNISVNVVGRYGRKRKINFHRLLSEKRKVNFMLVREPLERLLSAYLDKRVFSRKYNDQSFSFQRFLKRISKIRMTRLDRHIYPYFERCRPCEMQFDYIGLQYNFIDEMKILFQQIDAGDKIAIPNRSKTGYNTSLTSEKLVKQYFSEVPNELIHNLWAKYYKDYYIFGFPYPSHLMN